MMYKLNKFLAVALVLGCFTFGLGPISATNVSASDLEDLADVVTPSAASGKWMVRVRGIAILPDTDAGVSVNGLATPANGLEIDDRVVPELDITYFLTNNIALELVLALSKHDVTGEGGLAGVNVGDFYIIPPHLMLQYHFNVGNGFKPYVGVGVNYSIIFDEGNAAGFNGLDIDNGWGFSLQAGVDVALRDNWYLNVDVKKTWLNVDARTNLGAVPVAADIDVDPWIVGVGLGYRF